MVKKRDVREMRKEARAEARVKRKEWRCMRCGCGGGAYFLGFIGALVYYLSNATSFWIGVLGVLKALVWPVFVVLKILGL